MNNQTVIKRIVDFIESHMEEDLSLDKVAYAFNYSKFYLERIFKEETNCTVYKYIQGRRLTLAAQKLVETKKPIIEIAYEAHYTSQQSFTYAFNNLYQCSPQLYRKRGVFYPKQIKLSMVSSFKVYSDRYFLWGGKLAA